MLEGYSSNLAYYLNRLSNYSVSTIKLLPLGSDVVNASGVLQVVLPSTGILALPSFQWRFRGACTGSGAGTRAVFPKNFESLIQRLGVELNGATVQNPCNGYNDLFNLLQNNTCGAYGHSMQRAVLSGDVPFTSAAARGAVACSTTAVAAPTADQAAIHACVCEWLGFLGSAQPDYLMADILGDIRVTITLAGANVLARQAAGGALGTYQLTHNYFSIDVVRIQDGVYNSMIERRLAGGVPIEIPFEGIYAFTNTVPNMGQSTKFSVSSQSLDRVVVSQVLSSDRTAAGLPPGGSTVNAVVNYTENGAYFTYNNADATNCQLLVNSEYYPSYPQDSAYDFVQSMKNLNQCQDLDSASGITANGRDAAGGLGQLPVVLIDNTALTQYLCGMWSVIYNFKHLGAGADARLASGLNSYGSASNMYFNSINAGAGAVVPVATSTGDKQILIFVQTTSVLRCLAGKVLEVVA